MAQRHIVQSKMVYWKEKGYEVVVGAKKVGPPGTDQLILVEKKEKVKEPLQKEKEVKENAGRKSTGGDVRRTGKSDNDSARRGRGKESGRKGKSRR